MPAAMIPTAAASDEPRAAAPAQPPTLSRTSSATAGVHASANPATGPSRVRNMVPASDHPQPGAPDRQHTDPGAQRLAPRRQAPAAADGIRQTRAQQRPDEDHHQGRSGAVAPGHVAGGEERRRAQHVDDRSPLRTSQTRHRRIERERHGASIGDRRRATQPIARQLRAASLGITSRLLPAGTRQVTMRARWAGTRRASTAPTTAIDRAQQVDGDQARACRSRRPPRPSATSTPATPEPSAVPRLSETCNDDVARPSWPSGASARVTTDSGA